MISQTKLITNPRNNNRSTTLNILIFRVAYPIMLKLFKLFLKLIEVGFYGKNWSITINWKTCKVFRERLDKNNRDKNTELSKIVQIVGLWRKLWWIWFQLNFPTIIKFYILFTNILHIWFLIRSGSIFLRSYLMKKHFPGIETAKNLCFECKTKLLPLRYRCGYVICSSPQSSQTPKNFSNRIYTSCWFA